MRLRLSVGGAGSDADGVLTLKDDAVCPPPAESYEAGEFVVTNGRVELDVAPMDAIALHVGARN